MNRQTFISYSSRNRRIAEAIRNHLTGLGVDCWMAPESIMPGEQWAEAIAHVIPECKIMVLLWTAESMQSEQVINELTLADRSGVMILPFRVDEIEPEGAFKYYLYKTHWLDAFDGWKQKLDLLGERVLHNLDDTSASEKVLTSANRPRVAVARNAWQWISVSAAGLTAIATLATVGLTRLGKQPAIVAGAPESGDNHIAQCIVSRGGREVLNGPCRFRQFGGNGSFSLYPANGTGYIAGITSLTVTVNSPGVADVKGLVRDGQADNWGEARQESLERACWKGDTFRLCIYAQGSSDSQHAERYMGVAMVNDPPSNVRASPGGAFLCTVDSKRMLQVGEPKDGWYPTPICGNKGFIHQSQITF